MLLKIIPLIIISLFLCAAPIYAADDDVLLFDPQDNFGKDWGSMEMLSIYDSNDPLTITINMINWALIFLGVISLGLILYAGILWFFAGDEEERIEKAQDIIKGAVIGLLLVLASYGISYFVYYTISNATI